MESKAKFEDFRISQIKRNIDRPPMRTNVDFDELPSGIETNIGIPVETEETPAVNPHHLSRSDR